MLRGHLCKWCRPKHTIPKDCHSKGHHRARIHALINAAHATAKKQSWVLLIVICCRPCTYRSYTFLLKVSVSHSRVANRPGFFRTVPNSDAVSRVANGSIRDRLMSRIFTEQRSNNLSFGSRAFRVSSPKVWNTLPLHIRQSQ